jgi:hypothetical protein
MADIPSKFAVPPITRAFPAANQNPAVDVAAVKAAYQKFLDEVAARREFAAKEHPQAVLDAMKGIDNLGFNTPRQAITAVIQSPDWRTRFDIDPTRSVAEWNFMRVMNHYLRTGTVPLPAAPAGGGGGGGGARLLPFGNGSMFDDAIGGMTKNTVGRTPLG